MRKKTPYSIHLGTECPFFDFQSWILTLGRVSRWKRLPAICDRLWTWNVFIPWEKTENIEKELPSAHCVIFLPINSAWGYYISNGYSINCSPFFSLSRAVKTCLILCSDPPLVFDILTLETRWMKLLQAHNRNPLCTRFFLFVKLLVYTKLVMWESSVKLFMYRKSLMVGHG